MSGEDGGHWASGKTDSDRGGPAEALGIGEGLAGLSSRPLGPS